MVVSVAAVGQRFLARSVCRKSELCFKRVAFDGLHLADYVFVLRCRSFGMARHVDTTMRPECLCGIVDATVVGRYLDIVASRCHVT